MTPERAESSPIAPDHEEDWKSYVEPHLNISEYTLEMDERVIVTKAGFSPSIIYIIVEACVNDEYKVKRASDNEVIAEPIQRVYLKRVL